MNRTSGNSGAISADTGLSLPGKFSYSSGIATTGNATDFGDLISATSAMAGTSSQTRGVFAGGEVASATNVIQYITIDTTGNASDFGDLVAATYAPQGCSSAHGGL